MSKRKKIKKDPQPRTELEQAQIGIEQLKYKPKWLDRLS